MSDDYLSNYWAAKRAGKLGEYLGERMGTDILSNPEKPRKSLNDATPDEWTEASRQWLDAQREPRVTAEDKARYWAPRKPEETIEPITSTGGSTAYYELPKWATELRHLMEYKKMTPDQANIFKASYRLGQKEGTDMEYDLNKIIFFAECIKEKIKRGDQCT